MNEEVTIDRGDLIQLMAASGILNIAPTDKLDAAWLRTWRALATTPTEAAALHKEITKAQDEMRRLQ